MKHRKEAKLLELLEFDSPIWLYFKVEASKSALEVVHLPQP